LQLPIQNKNIYIQNAIRSLKQKNLLAQKVVLIISEKILKINLDFIEPTWRYQ